MSAINIAQVKPSLEPDQSTVQNLLIENGQLIETAAEYQRMGKIEEAMKYQERLHKNLMYLAKLADPSYASQMIQEIGQMVVPSSNENSSTPAAPDIRATPSNCAQNERPPPPAAVNPPVQSHPHPQQQHPPQNAMAINPHQQQHYLPHPMATPAPNAPVNPQPPPAQQHHQISPNTQQASAAQQQALHPPPQQQQYPQHSSISPQQIHHRMAPPPPNVVPSAGPGPIPVSYPSGAAAVYGGGQQQQPIAPPMTHQPPPQMAYGLAPGQAGHYPPPPPSAYAQQPPPHMYVAQSQYGQPVNGAVPPYAAIGRPEHPSAQFVVGMHGYPAQSNQTGPPAQQQQMK